MTAAMGEFLKICVEQGLNIVISGGTGSGKTTMLREATAAIEAGGKTVYSFAPTWEQIHDLLWKEIGADREGKGLPGRVLDTCEIKLRKNHFAKGRATNNAIVDHRMKHAMSGGITVHFTNDSGNRDVQVDYIQVNGQTRQSEQQSYNTGLYANGSCGGGGYSEWMHCNGAIGYGDTP